MRVAVTGAAGHLGANLVRELIAAGDEVRVLLRSDDRAVQGLAVERVAGDLFDDHALARLVSGAEVVFHAAALVSISGGQRGEVERVNVRGTERVASAALEARVRRLVHVSSVHALTAGRSRAVLDDSAPLADAAGDPAYDRSKAAAERAVLAAAERGLESVRLRPTAIVGPYDFKPSRIGRLIQALAMGKVPSLVRGGFDWVDARDVARTAVAAGRAGRPGEAYLIAGHWRTLTELASQVGFAAGVEAPRIALPIWIPRLGLPFVALAALLSGREALYTRESLRAVANSRRIDRAKAERELAHAPRDFARTIADTVRWFADGPRLPSPAPKRG